MRIMIGISALAFLLISSFSLSDAKKKDLEKITNKVHNPLRYFYATTFLPLLPLIHNTENPTDS